MLDRWAGYSRPADFIATLRDAMSDRSTAPEKQARFDKQPDGATAARLARMHESKFEFVDAARLYQRAQEIDPGKEYGQRLFRAQAIGYLNTGAFSAPEILKTADAVLAGKRAKPEDLLEVAALVSSVARRAGDMKMVAPYLTAAVDASTGITDPEQLKLRRSVLVEHALWVTGDKPKAAQLKRESLAEGWRQDPQQLNRYAWWCFENQVDLEQAESVARKGIELSTPGPDRAAIFDTAAEICNLRGNCKDSVSLIEMAVKEDPKNEKYGKQLERFQKLLAESK